MTRKRISVEEHFSTPEHLEQLRAISEGTYPSPEVLAEEEYILSDAPFLLFMNEPMGRQIAAGRFQFDVEEQLRLKNRMVTHEADDRHGSDFVLGDTEFFPASRSEARTRKTKMPLSMREEGA